MPISSFDQACAVALADAESEPSTVQWAVDPSGYESSQFYVVGLNDRRFFAGDESYLVCGGVAVVDKYTGSVDWKRFDDITADLKPVTTN